MDNRKRLQFDFTPDALEELDELQRKTGLPSRADLIRHALRFLQWTLEETYDKGANIVLEKDGKLRQVVFPFWNVKRPEEAIFATSTSSDHGNQKD